VTRPILHVIAGPNGAGKSSLYLAVLRRYVAAEFVNADLLIRSELGRHAETAGEAARGQELANKRRAALMSAGESLVTETTFSHISKVELVRSAKVCGYDVIVYHVNLDSPDLAVARVRQRTVSGGHAVPEDRIRNRYERNPDFIREAVLLADAAYVFDNSRHGEPPRRLLTLEGGRVTSISEDRPDWVNAIYATEIKGWGKVS